MELLKILNFILLNFSIVFSALLLLRIINKNTKATLSYTFLSVVTLYFSIITLILVLLGILGKINLINASSISYLVFILLLFKTKNKNLILNEFIDSFKMLNLKLSKVILGITIFTPIIIIMYLKFFTSIFQIPLDFDALVYHLPVVTEWLQTGSLMDIYYSAFAGPLAYYPSNFNLIYLWSALPLNNDFLINLLNFPLFIFLIIAIYFTANNFGISKKISLVVSAFPLYMPVFLQQAGSIFVDIYFTLTFVLSIYFLQEILKNRDNLSNSLLFGLSIGLFLGTKYLGLPYSILPIIAFILIHLWQKTKNISAITLGLISSFATGSFFYIRNLINSGNPLFPVEVNLFGKTILEGYPNANDKLVSSSLFENIFNFQVIIDFAKSYFTMTHLPGVIVFCSIIISCIYIAKSIKNKRIHSKDTKTAITLLICIVSYFLLYIKAPYSYRDLIHNIRYAMPFLVLASLNIGFLASKIKRLNIPFLILSTIAFLHSIAYLIISPEFKFNFDLWLIKEYSPILILLTITVTLLSLVLILFRKKILIFGSITATLVIFIYVLNFAYIERELISHRSYNKVYPIENQYWGIWNAGLWLDENTNNARVAYTGFHFHYPLIGRQFSRSTNYINLNNCKNCRYIDYKNNSDSIRSNPNFNTWLANLREYRKNYIVISPNLTPGVKSYEFEWINNNTEIFSLVKQFKNTYIYKIN